jgi:hypothetical protein
MIESDKYPNTGYFNEIDKYLSIHKLFNSFNMNDRIEINNIKNKIDSLIESIKDNNDPPLNIILIILREYKSRVDSLLQNLQIPDFDFNVPDNTTRYLPDYRHFTSDNNTPIPDSIPNYRSPLNLTQSLANINNIRRQHGTPSALGRIASQEYSQSSN